MSVVTTVVVILDTYPGEKELAYINSFTGNSVAESLGLVNDFAYSVDGHKEAEVPVFMGAYNYFEIDNFIKHLDNYEWDRSGDDKTCIIMHSNDENRINVWKPTEGKVL